MQCCLLLGEALSVNDIESVFHSTEVGWFHYVRYNRF